MPLIYTIARIFTSEEARHKGRPLYQEIVEFVRSQKISARCHVTRSMGGCFENGETATHGIEVLSFNMPLEITVILPQQESARLLPQLEAMVDEGLMTVEDKEVHWHKCRKQMIPRQVRVKEVMTRHPRTLPMDAPATEALGILLGAPFHGIPILDALNRPVGMITQGDLLRKPALPIKLGSLSSFSPGHLEATEKLLAGKRVADLMSQPALVIREDALLSKAVDTMLMKDVKRLPVVAANGCLAGMLSRLDVFRTIMDRSPDWARFDQCGVQLQNVTLAQDAMRTDTPTLPPSAPTWDAIKLIDTTSIKRVAVVDPEGRLLGLISERELLALFSDHSGGMLEVILANLSFPALARRHKAMLKALRARTVREIMLTDICSVMEDVPIDEALQLMVERKLKRIPVLGDQGRFRGMLTRESLLRSIQAHQAE
jgi:CBS domain-containing protein/PII-like signaling protein